MEENVDSKVDITQEQTPAKVDAVAEVAAAETSAVEEASMKFTHLLPYVSKIANASTSKGSLIRVLKAYAEFPLGASKPRLLNDNEKLLFNILQELQGHKSTILTEFMKNSFQKEQTLNQEKEVKDGN